MPTQRVVIRTTPEHSAALRSLAREKDTSVSDLARKYIRAGLKLWKKDVFKWIPDHNLGNGRQAQLQLRVPEYLFRALETIIDDLEYSRTDLYLRMIELGRKHVEDSA